LLVSDTEGGPAREFAREAVHTGRRGPVMPALVWWVVMAAGVAVAAVVGLYALTFVATVLGTLVAMAVAGLRAWCRAGRGPP
jgi:hypothetical protein